MGKRIASASAMKKLRRMRAQIGKARNFWRKKKLLRLYVEMLWEMSK